jgi:hypothetical protein
MDSLTARDIEHRRAWEAASAEFVERIRAEREGRTAHTAQYVLGLR